MADPAPEPADLSGQTLGDFQVLRKLGQGGMGQVYLARQLSLKREVALKLLRNDLARNDTALKRFQAEAEAVARISHPNIVQVFAIGEHDGRRYMALEYVEGRNLRDFLAKKGPPDLPVALTLLRQIAAALQRASELGIVHRDVKPENILLTRKAEVKVTDFGLSRLTTPDQQPLNLTQSGVTVGTPLYMAPEQVQGRPVDHRTDLYSFGVTAYHLLSGQPPFRGTTAFEVAMHHVQTQAESLAGLRPDLPADLCNLVHKLMAKDPADRYATAKDVLRDLGKLRDGLALGLSAPAISAGGMSVFGGPVPSGSTQMLPAASPPAAWPARVLGGLILLGVAAGGWFAYAATRRPPAAAAAGPGLPEVRPPDRVVTARERELLAKIGGLTAKPADVTDSMLELGILYTEERRFDDADATFKKLEADGPGRAGPLPRPAGPRPPSHVLAGRLGHAAVLAYRDKAKESVDEFVKAAGLFKPPQAAGVQLKYFLLKHPDFAQLVGEAVHRDAENLKAKKPPEKLPAELDALRPPGRG